MFKINAKEIWIPTPKWIESFKDLTKNRTIFKLDDLDILDNRVINNYIAIVEDLDVETWLYTYKDKHWYAYYTRKDGIDPICSSRSMPPQAMRSFKSVKSVKEHLADQNLIDIKPQITGIIKYNDLFTDKRVKAYYYDRNSAWSSIMIKDMPDFTKPPKIYEKVKNGQIGFDNDGIPVYSGRAKYVYNLIETPQDIKEWILKQYKNKFSDDPYAKLKGKRYLNIVIGCLQNNQPFWRSYIIDKANRYINSFWDPDTTLYINTDCVVSTKRIPELDNNLGTDLGQFKFKEIEFAIKQTKYDGKAYQINLETPIWRGMPSSCFKPGFDILVDETPAPNAGLKIYFDKETNTYKETKNG